MATLSVQTITPGGLKATYSSAAPGGDEFKAGDRTFFHARNDSGGSITIVVDDSRSVEPTAATAFNPDLTIVLAPGQQAFIGPLLESRFANRSNENKVAVTYSGTTDLTVAALKI